MENEGTIPDQSNPTERKTVKANAKNNRKKKPKPVKGKLKKNSQTLKSSLTFPPITLEKSLAIAQKIKELNGGNPWSVKEVSKAIEIGDTGKLYRYCASSRDYGITLGSTNTKEISITEFGKEIVYADNQEIELKKKVEAFLKIELFKNVLDFYKGSNLPEMKYLSNTLENKFNLPPSVHEEFSQVFKENCRDLGITTGNPLDENGRKGSAPTTIVVGEVRKGTKDSLKAFVIMPFTEKNDRRSTGFFKEVLGNLLIPAGIDAGFTVETAIKQGSDVIHSTIINDLLEADLVIADLTDHNPNVLFELGVRMAMDKPVALIKTGDTGRIFDVDSMLRVYEYNQNLWKSTIEKDVPELSEHFKAAWANRNSDQTYMKILRRGINTQSV
jgi:hypothetical protein